MMTLEEKALRALSFAIKGSKRKNSSGIVCKEWINDPTSYIQYVRAMGISAELQTTERSLVLQRIDKRGDYAPGNVRLILGNFD